MSNLHDSSRTFSENCDCDRLRQDRERLRLRNRELEDLFVSLSEYFQPSPGESLSDAIMAKVREEKLQSYICGLEAFAWWKDGEQFVGAYGTTLADAIADVRKLYQ